MTRRKRIKLKKVEWRRVEWQGEEYDADCSDVEGLVEMPSPATCEFREPEPEPKTERPPQSAAGSAKSIGKLSPGKVGGNKLKKKQSRSSPDSGNGSTPKSRPRSVKFKKNQGLESSRSSDSAMGSSARNLPKPTKSSQVKHKAKHKFKEFEHEIRKIQTSVITLLNGNGNELETEIEPDLEEIVRLISEMRKKDPDLPIEERLCEYSNFSLHSTLRMNVRNSTEGWQSTGAGEGFIYLRSSRSNQPEDPDDYGENEVMEWRTCN